MFCVIANLMSTVNLELQGQMSQIGFDREFITVRKPAVYLGGFVSLFVTQPGSPSGSVRSISRFWSSLAVLQT